MGSRKMAGLVTGSPLVVRKSSADEMRVYQESTAIGLSLYPALLPKALTEESESTISVVARMASA